MKYKFFLHLAIATLLPIAAICGLYIHYRIGNFMNGGFSRKFLNIKLQPAATWHIDGKYLNVIGNLDNKVFLSSTRNRGSLFGVDLLLKDTITIPMNTKGLVRAKIGIRTIADSPYIYQAEGITPSAVVAHLNDLEFNSINIDLLHVSDFFPVSPHKFIIKKYDTILRQDILVLQNAKDTSIMQRYVLEKHGDGRFSLDGQLLGDGTSGKYLYLYYYQNKFTCFDTNLAVLYSANTIDTNRMAKLETAKLKSDNSLRLSISPPYVNRQAVMAGEYIYIHSNIKSDNEVHQQHNTVVIDRYEIKNGRYTGSFTIPPQEGEPCRDFFIGNNNIIALYKTSLVFYDQIY